MASPHVVRDLSFAVSFASEELAIEEHNRLGSFLAGRLTAVVDEVFSQLSPGGGSVARIEKLEVDLGELPIASYYEDAEARLRERLEEALRLKLAGLGGASFGPGGAGARSGAASEGIVSAGQNELDLFVHFVETGHLPWNIHTLSRTMLDELLGRILAGQRTQLAARLRAFADKASAADRLAAQFSEELLAGMADGFDANWEELAEEFRGWDGRPDWASLLLALMDGRSGQARSRDWRVLRRAVERAVETGDADPLRSFWAEMLAENPALLAEVVREVGASAEARRRMARGFPEPMLVAIAGVLEPGDIGFLEIAAGRLDSARAAAKAQGGNQAQDKAWFWEFTLTCLLAASGGGFERKAYVEGLCREIAARWGVDYERARDAFAEVVGAATAGDLHRAASRPLAEPPAAGEAMAANGGLRRAEQRVGPGDGPPAMGDAKDGGDHRNRVESRSEAIEPNGRAGLPQRERGQVVSGIEEAEVLEGLADGGASGPGPRSSPRSEVWPELWTAELETALATGDAAPIAGVWGAWMRGRRAEIARVVRGLGLDAHGVREIARNFPLPMLRDIAEALEPAEAQFVEYLCEQPVLSRGEAAEDAESGPVQTRLLWELTLNYMLVERGSAFNRRSYLGSLARGMAGRHNLRYEDLVDSMIASLEQTPAPSAIGADLLAILGELRSGSALGGAADAASRDALKAARRSEGAQRSSRPGAEDGIDPPLRIDAAGLAGEFMRRFLPAEWAAGVDRAELLAEALRRFAFEKGASPEDIHKTLLAGLASSPVEDERPRRLLQLLRELRGESLLGPLRAEMRSLTVAEVMRSCELYDFFAERIRGAAGWVWVAAGQQAVASDPDLASDLDRASDLDLGPELRLMLDELQRDYPWQLKRLAREAGMGDAKTRVAGTGEARTGGSQVEGPPAATAGPREGSLPDEDLRALARALSGTSGRRRLP